MAKKYDSRLSLPVVSLEKRAMIANCLRHSGETVCSDCLVLGPHKEVQYSWRGMPRLRDKDVEEFSGDKLKKEEFKKYLKKIDRVEGEALEFTTKEVNNVFDGIVASVEAQRNKALQSAAQRVKEISCA